MGRMYGTKTEEFANKYYNEMEDHMNKVTLLGRVGQDIETQNVNGNYLAKFTLATTEKWKNKAGELQEKTSWHKVTAWGNTAKAVADYSAKGKRLLIEGKIDYRSWDKEDGSKGYATDIIAQNVNIIDFVEKKESHTTEDGFTTSDIPF